MGDRADRPVFTGSMGFTSLQVVEDGLWMDTAMGDTTMYVPNSNLEDLAKFLEEGAAFLRAHVKKTSS